MHVSLDIKPAIKQQRIHRERVIDETSTSQSMTLRSVLQSESAARGVTGCARKARQHAWPKAMREVPKEHA